VPENSSEPPISSRDFSLLRLLTALDLDVGFQDLPELQLNDEDGAGWMGR